MNTAVAQRADESQQQWATLRTQLEQRAEEFRMVLPSHISPEKLQRTILTAAQMSPVLLQCERRSFLTACMKAAQDGLLPDGKEAAIVPFNHRMKDPERGWLTIKIAQYLPMAYGLRKKILQSGEIKELYSQIVYKQEIDAGLFVYEEGSNRILRHRLILDLDFRPVDADIALAYSIATFADGTQSFEVMRRFQIDAVREASQTGAAYDDKGNPREAKGPWVEWFPEMAKKSVIRRHSKSLPQSSDLIDIEAQDIERAAKSAALLLDGSKPDAPRAMIETDELTDRIDQVAAQREPAPPPPAPDEPAPLPDQPDLQPMPDEEPAALPGEEEREPTPAESYGVDQWQGHPVNDAFTPDVIEAEAEERAAAFELQAAEDFVRRSKACELMLDFKRLEEEAGPVLAEMSADHAVLVDVAFEEARKRLKPKREKASV